MAHIVIMGAGLGGMPAAHELRETLPKEHELPFKRAMMLPAVKGWTLWPPCPSSATRAVLC